MREMKDSGLPYVGIIPKHWECIRGKYILKYLSKPVKEDDGVITCFRDGQVTLRSNRREDGFTMADKEIGYQGIDVGDLVVHGMDGFAGAIGISDSRGKASPVLNVLETEQNKRFIMYYLRSMAYGDVFVAMATGIRVRSCDLRWNKLANFEYLVPPIDEQEKIVTFLDTKCSEIDALISDIQAQIETLEQYKRSTIIKTVLKGLNPALPIKDSKIDWVGEIPVHWNTHPLYYYFNERKNTNALGKENNLLSLSYGKIIRKDINTNGGLLPNNFNSYNIIEKDDIVLRLTDLQNDRRSLRTGIAKERGIITSAYVTLRAIKTLNAHYFYYLLHAYDLMKVLYNMGSGVRQGLNYEELSKMMLIEPTLDEQNEIVNFLDKKCNEAEACINSKKEQIATLEAYKKSIIFEYVTGKKEVI